MKNYLIVPVGVFLGMTALKALSAGVTQETRVGWLASCPSDPKPLREAQTNRSALLGALVTAVGAKVIDGAVDSAAGALKAAGETKTVVTTAKSSSDFYEITASADLKVKSTCLVVVRGVFDPKAASPSQWAENSDDFKGLQSSTFRLEAKLHPLRGLKYFQLVPEYLNVSEFQESGWFGSKDRDYVVAVSLTVPGGAQPFGSAEMTFKDVARNEYSKWDGDPWLLRSAASMPITFPPESADVTKAKSKREAELAPLLLAQDILEAPSVNPFAKAPDVYDDDIVQKKVKLVCDAIDRENRHLNDDHRLIDDRCAYRVAQAKVELDTALESAHRNSKRHAWAEGVCALDAAREQSDKTATKCSNEPAAKDTVGKSFTYVTTQLTLSETREGSKFAKFLGNALGSAKSDVSSALQSSVLPKSQAVKDSEEVAARTARSTVLIADLEVTKSEEGLADTLMQDPPVPVDITSARIALLKAKIAANEAYRKASLPIPFPEIGS